MSNQDRKIQELINSYKGNAKRLFGRNKVIADFESLLRETETAEPEKTADKKTLVEMVFGKIKNAETLSVFEYFSLHSIAGKIHLHNSYTGARTDTHDKMKRLFCQAVLMEVAEVLNEKFQQALDSCHSYLCVDNDSIVILLEDDSYYWNEIRFNSDGAAEKAIEILDDNIIKAALGVAVD